MRFNICLLLAAVFLGLAPAALFAQTQRTPSAADYLFLRAAAPQVQSALLENALGLQFSRAGNALIAAQTPNGSAFPFVPNLQSEFGRSISLGYSWSTEGGFTRGTFTLTNLTADAPPVNGIGYAFTSITSGTTSVTSEQTLLEISSGGKVTRRNARYDQEFYFLSGLDNPLVRGLGLRAGLDFTQETQKFSGPRLFSGTSTLRSGASAPTVTSGVGFSRFAEFENKQDAGLVRGGLLWRLPLGQVVELDFDLDYLYGVYSPGESAVKSTTLLPLGSTVLPATQETKKTWEADMTGWSGTAGLTVHVSETLAVRVYGSDTAVRYTLRDVKTSNPPETTTALLSSFATASSSSSSTSSSSTLAAGLVGGNLPDQGPFPSPLDRVREIGVELAVKF